MKKIHRAIHIDFHTMPGIFDFGKNFDASEIAETLKNAHVDYVNVFGRCNIGYSYYPTKIGETYPGMQGNLLGDTIKECHKRGIGVTAYINGGLNHRLLTEEPGLSRVNEKGQIMKDDRLDNFFRSPCMNSRYRQYLLEEIREMLEYEPDGIFVDCMSPVSCYCPTCVRKMKEKGIDIEEPAAVYEFAWETQMEVYKEIRDLVPLNLRLYLNTSRNDMVAEWVSQAEMECLPGVEWSYDFFSLRAPYYRKFSEDRLYMTGRFQLSWGDYAGVKPLASMEHDVYDALMHGYVPSIGDHMHPRDGINKSLYEKIGKIYEYVERMESYTEGTREVTEAAILVNKVNPERMRNRTHRPQDNETGAAKMLAELKLCYDVINEDMEFDDYRLLVIPEKTEINERVLKKLEKFKGAVLSSGNSLVEGGIWDYISEYEPDSNTDGFYEWEGQTLPQYSCGIKMQSDYSLIDYIEPYFNKHFDGLQGYFYVPPMDKKGFSAVAGKDNRIHICFNVFEAYQQTGSVFHRDLVEMLLDKILPERLIKTNDLPRTSRATLMSGARDLLHIKTTYPELRGARGVIEEHACLPAGRKISVAGEYRSVYQVPDMQPIFSEIIDGRTEIILPEIIGYAPFLLCK